MHLDQRHHPLLPAARGRGAGGKDAASDAAFDNSLARGLASRTAESLNGKGVRYAEVEPDSLASAADGKTQKAVTESGEENIVG